MRDTPTAALALLIACIVVAACLWLRRQKLKAKVEKVPFWRLVFLTITYGGAAWFFLATLFFGESTSVTPERSALGDVLQTFGDAVGIYTFVFAPIGILGVGIATAVARGNSIYHRVVYLGCAGYALFLIAFFVLAASQCKTPPGGIP